MSERTDLAFLAFALAALFALQIYLNRRASEIQASWVEPPRTKTEKTHPELAKAMAFGHTASLVDSLTIGFLADPAYARVADGVRSAVYFDLELATDIDAAFAELYIIGGSFLTVVRNDVGGGKLLLEKGERFRNRELLEMPQAFREKYWKNAWAIPLGLAYIHLFELDDLQNAEKFYRLAGEVPGAPAYIQRLVTRFDKSGGVFEVGIRLLNFMISGATTDEAKQKLVKKRDALFLSQFFYQLNDGFKTALKKLPEYRSATDVPHKTLQKWWENYRKRTSVPDRDPFGGKIFLNDAGEVTSTTPREKVFGIR
ncbi:MAG: hypothetical protein JNL01_06015 [Bdellovibrionales bacterium]|nr:hypothetical protein [Bdellovibrionales bacterium]